MGSIVCGDCKHPDDDDDDCKHPDEDAYGPPGGPPVYDDCKHPDDDACGPPGGPPVDYDFVTEVHDSDSEEFVYHRKVGKCGVDPNGFPYSDDDSDEDDA
jgi:hypothetical protein